jgi:hypothetical protein
MQKTAGRRSKLLPTRCVWLQVSCRAVCLWHKASKLERVAVPRVHPLSPNDVLPQCWKRHTHLKVKVEFSQLRLKLTAALLRTKSQQQSLMAKRCECQPHKLLPTDSRPVSQPVRQCAAWLEALVCLQPPPTHQVQCPQVLCFCFVGLQCGNQGLLQRRTGAECVLA